MIKITNVYIKNFRAIRELTVGCDNLNFFVGKNDSGKSTVLKALNLFFNNETDFGHRHDFDIDFCNTAIVGKNKAKEIIIELTFDLPSTFAVKSVKWRKIWRKGTEKIHSDEKVILDNVKWTNAQAQRAYILLDKIKYSYIPAVKSNDYFQNLLVQLYQTITNATDSIEKQTTDISTKLTMLTKSITDNIFRQLKISSNLQMSNDLSNIFREAVFNTTDATKKKVLLDYRGDGIRARHIPSILAYISDNIAIDNRGGVNPRVIWGYEEPENGMELNMAIEMANEFYSYKDKVQMFITTHSPAFYQLKEKENVNCFFVKKSESATILSKEIGTNFDDELGLMPFIQPYIQTALQEIKETKQNIEQLQNTHKPLLLVEDTYIQLYKLAYLKLGDINEITETNIDDLFAVNAPFEILGGYSCGGLQGILKCKNPTMFRESTVCLFDYDNEGYKTFKKVKQEQGNTYSAHNGDNNIIKHRDAKLFAMMLPVPERLRSYINASSNFCFVEIETLIADAFFDAEHYPFKSDRIALYDVKDKSTFWRKLLGQDKSVFTDFTALFEKIAILFS